MLGMVSHLGEDHGADLLRQESFSLAVDLDLETHRILAVRAGLGWHGRVAGGRAGEVQSSGNSDKRAAIPPR